ncbi:MAG: hypothetical protein HKN94_12915 [Acidimicrobiales bacterium]|nr:hypothetical protein [Acidimicrobiales bacterium]
MLDPEVDAVVARIRRLPGRTRLVAVDGPGGSGKTTFADRLSSAADGAPIVHTDDFASADNPVNWWPRMLNQVIAPLGRGERGRYQRYDWPSKTLAEWHEVDPAPIVIIEGVSAGRAEWVEHLDFVIWIDTPREVRLQRAIERDGPGALDDWQVWIAEEDAHYERDATRNRADLIIDGTR